MKKDIYNFGMCKMCGLARPLKNGICSKCKKKPSKMPDFFKDIFDNPYFGE